MKVILYVLMVAAAALNTYHPKKEVTPVAPVQAAKPVAADKADNNAIAFNNSITPALPQSN